MEPLSLFEAARQPPILRKRNAIWDALEEIFEYTPLTQSEIKLWGKLTSSLSRAGATRDSLIYAAKEYQKEFATASLTPTALEKHYSRYAARKPKKIIICDECGIGGGFHLDDCIKKRGPDRSPGLNLNGTPAGRKEPPTQHSTPIR